MLLYLWSHSGDNQLILHSLLQILRLPRLTSGMSKKVASEGGDKGERTEGDAVWRNIGRI